MVVNWRVISAISFYCYVSIAYQHLPQTETAHYLETMADFADYWLSNHFCDAYEKEKWELNLALKAPFNSLYYLDRTAPIMFSNFAK